MTSVVRQLCEKIIKMDRQINVCSVSGAGECL